VELLARRMAREHFAGSSLIDVMLYERDTLSSTAARPGLVPVSWSADTLIEEVLLSPTLEIADGEAVEGKAPPSECAPLNWFGETIDARLVGHEEIWNMRQVEGSVVRRCAYAYAFSAGVMEVLRQGVDRARDALYVPDLSEEIQGKDTLALKVADVHTGRTKALAWHLDHGRVWQRLGINAVQYQVCSSIRLFCEIMFSGSFQLRPLQHGSSIPISDSGWRRIATLMDRLGMHWKEIGSEDVHLLDEQFSAAGMPV